MAERVETGGTKRFEYGRSHNPRFKEEQRKEIEEAYGKYYERKRNERRKRNIIIWIIVVILILIAGYFILF